MKIVAEDLSQEFNWIQQLRRQRMYIDHDTAWNATIGGYDLNLMTDYAFDHFTTTYIYDLSNKRIIPEINSDQKISKEMLGSSSEHKFFRTGNFVVFVPDIDERTEIEFYYQTSFIAYDVETDIYSYSQDFNGNLQYSVLDDKLIVRGAASRYRMAEAYDNAPEDASYLKYLELVKSKNSPQGILQGHNEMLGFGDIIMSEI
jgi:hypothetical protein